MDYERKWVKSKDFENANSAVCPKCGNSSFYTLTATGRALTERDLREGAKTTIDPTTIEPSPRMGSKMKARILDAKRRALESLPNAEQPKDEGLSVQRLVRLEEVLRIVSEHPEYPEPCPMLHEVAAKAAAEMDKEWVMHMVREACRQTKVAILADLKKSLPNDQVMAHAARGATGGDSLDCLVRLRDVAEKAAWEYKNAVKAAFPVGCVIVAKTNAGPIITGEVMGHGLEWSCKYPDEITVRNVKTGKRRTVWVRQIQPNVKEHASLTEGELRSEQDSAPPQPIETTAGQGLCDAPCSHHSSLSRFQLDV